jgi:NAD(P)-dependent dehydrogenase (short-subunit alcohol dehydrogenase family)
MAGNKQKKYNNAFTATITGIRDLFRKQIPSGELKPTDRLDGKTVLVDGSSSGLGFAIAVDVARRGARVIMACRSGIPEMGERVKNLSGNPDVHMLQVDYSDLNSIKNLVNQLQTPSISGEGAGGGVSSFQGAGGGVSSFQGDVGGLSSHQGTVGLIDILICNAGIVPKKSRKTPQGLEEMFMVNYFSKFVFVKMVVEAGCLRNLNESIPRIIFVASESHRNPEKFDWADFGLYREYGIGKSIELYGYYKLLLTTFSSELSRRLNPNGKTNCSVFSMCPGPVNSNIAREAPKLFQPLLKLVFGIFFRSPAKAAVPVVYLASSPDVEGKPFDYFFLMTRKTIDEKASGPENGKRLWEYSERLWKKLNDVRRHTASGSPPSISFHPEFQE